MRGKKKKCWTREKFFFEFGAIVMMLRLELFLFFPVFKGYLCNPARNIRYSFPIFPIWVLLIFDFTDLGFINFCFKYWLFFQMYFSLFSLFPFGLYLVELVEPLCIINRIVTEFWYSITSVPCLLPLLITMVSYSSKKLNDLPLRKPLSERPHRGGDALSLLLSLLLQPGLPVYSNGIWSFQ